jgi:hypothetical protein
MLTQLNAAAAKNGTLTLKPLNNPSNNYTTNLPFRKTSDSFDIKSDFTITEKDHLSGRYSYQRVVTFQAPAFDAFLGGPAGGGFEANGNQKSYSTGLNYDHAFSPTFLTEVRVGVAHLGNSAQPIDYGSTDATTIGVPGVNISDQPFTSGQVAVTLDGGFSNPLIGYSASVPWIRAESNIDVVNNWTKIIGNHTIKWGVDVRGSTMTCSKIRPSARAALTRSTICRRRVRKLREPRCLTTSPASCCSSPARWDAI